MKVTPFLHAPLRSWVIVFSRTCFFKRVAHLKKNNPVSVNAKRCTRAADIEPGSRQTRLKMWSLHDRGKIGRGRTKSTERESSRGLFSLGYLVVYRCFRSRSGTHFDVQCNGMFGVSLFILLALVCGLWLHCIGVDVNVACRAISEPCP
jgi:hypothetical protein